MSGGDRDVAGDRTDDVGVAPPEQGGSGGDGVIRQDVLPEAKVIAGETIAVAGVKGGVGKTTVSLGLAEAFSRSDRETVVVDADRQLPNLHVLAGVDRDPSLSDLGRKTAVRDVLQRRPDNPNVGIISAPRVGETPDFAAQLDRLEVGERQLLVDCPSGTGPDAVEAISAADGAVVVTTTSERSVAAAELTLRIADRVETPVRGAVVSRAERVADWIQSRLDVPVLGAVPEVRAENPLTVSSVGDAFDEVLYCIETEYSVRMDSAAGIDR